MMNHTEILQKLVNLLGRSENDPEVIEILTELGVKLPLKRPKKDVNYHLLESKNWGFYVGFEYADSFGLPLVDGNLFREKEMVLHTIQDISKNDTLKNAILPFNITWQFTIEDLISTLGNYAKYVKKWNTYFWVKDDVVIMLEFDGTNAIESVTYRLINNHDVELLKIKQNESNRNF